MSIKSMFLTVLSLCMSLALHLHAQEKERLTFVPQRPVSGDSVSITYRPLPQIKGAKDIKAIVYSYCNFEWQADQVALKQAAADWKATFKIPEDAGILVFKFVADTLVDNNNDETFACMLSDKTGRFKVGAYVGWGFLRAPEYGESIPGYFKSDMVSISDSAMYHWVDMEVNNRRESNIPMSYNYALTSKNAGLADTNQRIARIMRFLLSERSEDALIQAGKIASLVGNTQQSDSLSAEVLKLYPQGKWALKTKMQKVKRESDITKAYQSILDIIQNNPTNASTDVFLSQYGLNYSNLYQTLLIIDAMNKRYDHLAEYLPLMDFGSTISLYYKLIFIPHSRKDIADDVLLPYAKNIVKHAEDISKVRDYNNRFFTKEAWEIEADRLLSTNMYVSYVEMLKNTGNKDEALEYARKAQKSFDYKSAPLNENQAILLSEKGDKQELKDVLEKSVYKNQMSEGMMDMLKNLYEKEKGSDEGYDTYLQGLKNPTDKSSILAEIEKYKVTGVMPEWKLTDDSGKTVSSNDLKGKVYILDFWASWCVPCKASFPGMKMAVEHYKDDKDVIFYFVDTQEVSTKYQTSAVSYLQKNNYPFNLLFDNKKAGSKMNDELVSKVMSIYKTSGIPLKVIVDKAGNVRFLSIGYKGSPSGLADELIEMIEQAKQN